MTHHLAIKMTILQKYSLNSLRNSFCGIAFVHVEQGAIMFFFK
jgi:hypothetical protein